MIARAVRRGGLRRPGSKQETRPPMRRGVRRNEVLSRRAWAHVGTHEQEPALPLILLVDDVLERLDVRPATMPGGGDRLFTYPCLTEPCYRPVEVRSCCSGRTSGKTMSVGKRGRTWGGAGAVQTVAASACDEHRRSSPADRVWRDLEPSRLAAFVDGNAVWD